MSAPILSVKDLKVFFESKTGSIFNKKTAYAKAVNGISFDVHPGETLGIVGESGCGKSTLIRAILNLNEALSGEILWKGEPITNISESKMRKYRQRIQIIFQDPLSSLNPRMTIGQLIAEPLLNFMPELGAEKIKEAVLAMMKEVGLVLDMYSRFPHEFSGGQCQRIGIARALILEPELLICDEPVSALDVSIRSQIMNLLNSLKKKHNLTMLFISHDMSVIRYLCDRVMVLYLGKVMEMAGRETFFPAAKHPYSKSLLASVPDISGGSIKKIDFVGMGSVGGEIPSPFDEIKGCVFQGRCLKVQDLCRVEEPKNAFADKQGIACFCHFPS